MTSTAVPWGTMCPAVRSLEAKLPRRSASGTIRFAHRRTVCRPRAAAGALSGVMEKMAAANAEMLARKEGKELVGKKTGGVQPLKSFPVEVVTSKPEVANKVLETLGCMCISGVLSDGTAESLLQYINEESDRSKAAVTSGDVEFSERFGGVNCRGMNGIFGNRQDMFLPMNEPIVREAMTEIVQQLGPLLDEAMGPEGMLHELSCLVADPGSPRQCIHADTIHLPCPQYPDVSADPLYTFFVALQDVEDNMGHTTFLPQTHTSQAHILWNSPQRQKEKFIESSSAVISSLKRGDIALFDSRVLHCGCANTSDKRRVLFYFTASRTQRWPLPGGLHGSNSRRAEDVWQWQLKDLGLVSASS